MLFQSDNEIVLIAKMRVYTGMWYKGVYPALNVSTLFAFIFLPFLTG